MNVSVESVMDRLLREHKDSKMLDYKYWMSLANVSMQVDAMVGAAFFILAVYTPYLPVGDVSEAYTMWARLIIFVPLSVGAAAAAVCFVRAWHNKQDLYARSVLYALRGSKPEDF